MPDHLRLVWHLELQSVDILFCFSDLGKMRGLFYAFYTSLFRNETCVSNYCTGSLSRPRLA